MTGTGQERAGAPRPTPPRRPDRPAPDRDRGRRRRRLRILGGAALVVLLGWVVLGSPLLEVTRVEVVGAVGGWEPAVRRASEVRPGDALALVWPARVSGRVETVPWVARARVQRSWPHTVRITVEPRVPVGYVTVPGPAGVPRYLVVDGSGRVLWRAALLPGAIPELVGVADVARPGGEIAPRVLARAADALAPGLAARTTAVAFTDGSLSVRTGGGTEVRFGRPVEVAVKSRVAAAVLDTLGEVRPSYLDVSVPSSPVSG